MGENTLAEQVAAELKRLLTASAQSVLEDRCENAREYLDQALLVTGLIGYHAGSAMALYNLANLHIITGDIIAALETAGLALDKARQAGAGITDYEKLARAVFLAVQKEGVECAKNKDYRRSLSCFEAAAARAPEDKKAALERRIALLRKVLDERR